MIDLRSIVYSMGPVGMAYEYHQTGKVRPDPVGMAGWLMANSGAMYAASAYANPASIGGQTAYSVYAPVVREEVANLRTIIRGSSKKPPLGVFATLAIGFDVLRTADEMLGLTEVPLEQQFY